MKYQAGMHCASNFGNWQTGSATGNFFLATGIFFWPLAIFKGINHTKNIRTEVLTSACGKQTGSATGNFFLATGIFFWQLAIFKGINHTKNIRTEVFKVWHYNEVPSCESVIYRWFTSLKHCNLFLARGRGYSHTYIPSSLHYVRLGTGCPSCQTIFTHLATANIRFRNTD